MKRLFKNKDKNAKGADLKHHRRGSEGHSYDWLGATNTKETVGSGKSKEVRGGSKNKRKVNLSVPQIVNDSGPASGASSHWNVHDNSPVSHLIGEHIGKAPITRSKSTSFEPDVRLLDQIADESITQTVTRSLMSAISGEDNKIDATWSTSSRLNKTLIEVLKDRNALPYFIEFMDSIGAVNLLRFWLAAESFASSHPLASLDGDDEVFNSCDYQNHANSEILKDQGVDRDELIQEKAIFKSVQNDAVSLYDKYVSLEAQEKIRLVEDIRVRLECNICREDGRVLPDCFKEAQQFALEKMERIFLYFLCSEMYNNYQVDILTSTRISVADILYNELAMFYFREFMEQENAINYLQFWEAADNFRQQLINSNKSDKNKAKEAQDDAMIIYDKYFSLQATTSLGVDDIVRFDIENKICEETGPTLDCFKTPQKYTYYLIEEVFLPSFLHSNLYFKYLSELINKSQPMSDIITKIKPILKDGIDEDDEELEAVSMQAIGRKKNDASADAVENNLLTDVENSESKSDENRSRGPLSFGYIDQFGRFITEAEPEPGHKKKSGSKLTRAMQKITGTPDQQAQDEIAWKVAMMILRDVSSEQRIGESMSLSQNVDDNEV